MLFVGVICCNLLWHILINAAIVNIAMCMNLEVCKFMKIIAHDANVVQLRLNVL